MHYKYNGLNPIAEAEFTVAQRMAAYDALPAEVRRLLWTLNDLLDYGNNTQSDIVDLLLVNENINPSINRREMQE